MDNLTHIDAQGHANMVDVGAKDETRREATAQARVRMLPATLDLIRGGKTPKGDVMATCRIAGIQAAKKCWDLIPMCHPLLLSSVVVDLVPDTANSTMEIRATCKVSGKTGVEMEALTAASVAALTLYDMCKAVDRGMVIEQLCLVEKKGGKSGHWVSAETN